MPEIKVKVIDPEWMKSPLSRRERVKGLTLTQFLSHPICQLMFT